MTTGTANNSIVALLIQEAAGDAGPILEALAMDKDHPVNLQHAERFSTALARIAGGGVDIVLLDLSGSSAPENSARESSMDGLLQLLREAPQVPAVVLCRADDERLALEAVRAGAAAHVTNDQIGTNLHRVLHATVEAARNAQPHTGLTVPDRQTNGDIIALLGTKGGVGTTTVALNIASTLARGKTVILAEMRPTFGTLMSYLTPHGPTRNVSHCLNPDSSAGGSTEVGAALWAYKQVPGLSILFGPQTTSECAQIEPGRAKAIVQSLSALADYVIVDLPPSLSEANRAIMEQSRSTALVLERDPVSVKLAGSMARAIESWNSMPEPAQAVIVHRASVGDPMELLEIGSQLNCRVLEVIPPAADVCLSAQTAGVPLVALHPESLVASSLKDLSETLAKVGAAARGEG